MADVTQGKCPACRMAFRWSASVKLREAYCPNYACGSKLVATSKFYEGSWHDSTPITVSAAPGWWKDLFSKGLIKGAPRLWRRVP